MAMSVESTFRTSSNHNNRRRPLLETVDEDSANFTNNNNNNNNNRYTDESSITDFLAMVHACPQPQSRSSAAELLTTPPDSPKKQQQQKRKRSLSRVTSSPSIATTMKESHSVPDLDLQKQQSPVAIQTKKARMRHSISAPILNKPILFGGASASTLSDKVSSGTDKFSNVHPQDYLESILRTMGISANSRPALSVDDFFLPVLPQHTEGYGPTIISAVREEDLEALGRIRDDGGTLQCCNKFGESIVHMACRRGSLPVLHYLLRNGVSIRVIDDYGRTPLHDALWTQEPEFQLVKTILLECPDLLFMTDRRGFAPLSYVRRDHWCQWCNFLDENRELLIPRELC